MAAILRYSSALLSFDQEISGVHKYEYIFTVEKYTNTGSVVYVVSTIIESFKSIIHFPRIVVSLGFPPHRCYGLGDNIPRPFDRFPRCIVFDSEQ